MSQPQQQQQYSKQRMLQQQQHQQQQQQQQRWHYAHVANNDMNMFAGGVAGASGTSSSQGMFRGSAGMPGNGMGGDGGRRNMCNSNMGYDLEMGRCAPNAYYGNFQQNQLQRQQHALQISRRHQQQQQQQQQQRQQQQQQRQQQFALQHQFHYQQEHQQQQQQQRQLQFQPHIKSEPIDPMEQILTPTIEMEELIIKSEPPDEQAYNNYIKNTQQHQALPRIASISLPSSSSSASLSSLPASSSVNDNFRQFCPDVTIKEEFPRPVEQQQQKPLNFPRLKVQTERSGTLPICQRCKQVFLKKQSYIRHVAQSTCDIVEYDFKCDVCSMSFMSNEELMSHEQLHRLNKFFCHKYCGKYFDTIESCEMHEFQNHEYATFVCNICSATFPNRELLFSHMPQHRQQPRFDCPVCRLWFQTPLELHQHRLASPYFCGKYYDSNTRNSEFRPPTVHASSSQMSSQRARFNTPDARSLNSSSSIVQGMPRRYFPPSATISPNNRSHSQDRFNMSSMTGRNVNANVPSSLPRIKTEIKTEPDLLFSQNEYSPHSSSHTPTQQRYVNDYTDDSFSSSASHSFSNNFSDASSNFGSNSRAEVIDDNEDSVCCVPKCGTRKRSSPSLQYFGFPRDEKYLHQWLHNLKMMHRQADTNFDELRICSLHFPKRCINRYSLCYWAVPTFNLGHDDVANLYQNREITNCFTTGDNARCSMPGCSSQRGESNLKFYNFPKEVKMLIKWCQNARLPVHTKEPRHFCSRHFEDRCFGKFRLKPWAVPTLHLGTPYGRIHDNPSVLILEEKKCCLPHCKRSRSLDFNLSLYRFPRDETLLRRWCYNLRLDPDVYRGKNHKICSSHFIKEVLGLRKLSAGAVPTLNLGHNDTFNYYENELYAAPPPPPPAKSYTFHNSSAGNSGISSVSHYASVSLSSSPTNFSSASSEARPNSSSTNLMDFADLCCVPGCPSTRSTENITLHTIPRRPEQMLKWCHNLKMDPSQIHKGLRICNLHFEPYCIGGCMRPFAVPTLNLGHDDQNIHRNPEVIKKLNIRETCCVQQCKRNRDRDRANLHRFPSKPEMLAKWCANLNKPVPDGTRLFNDAICEIHFEDRCLRNKRLEKWAIPTLNLGHDKIVHQLPSEAEVAELWARLAVPTTNNGEEEGECCVESCKRNPEIDDIKLYRMPDNPEILAKWAHNLQIDVSDLPMLRICNLHFEPRCIGKRLYSWAIPTMNLGKNVVDLYENPVHHVLVYKKEKPIVDKIIEYSEPIPKVPWAPRCCLPHCRNKRGVNNVQLFRIPHSNRSMLAKWCHNLQIPLTQTKPRRVCSTHFEPHVLTKRCPMPQAVPTLDLNTPPGYKIYQNPSRLKVVKVSVQTICSVPSCKKTRGEGVQLFRLPHKGTQLRKWVHNLRLWEGHAPNVTVRAQMRICSSHFEPHSFGAKRLVPGAIPTLNVGHDNLDDLYPNEAQPFSEIQCVVAGCNSIKDADNNVRLFKFPCDDEDLLWKWCNNLKMNPIDCNGVRICNQHFEEDCMGPKNLYKWAIPTLELGHNDSEIELIANPKPEDRYTEAIAKCCVPTCGKTRKYDDVQLNSFPKHPRGFRRWKHNLKLEHLDFKKRDQYKICTDHFEEICLGKNRLKYGAIPTLNLGHDDTSDLYKVKAEDMHYILFGKMRPAEKSTSVDADDGDVDENESLSVCATGDTVASLESENKCNYPDCAASKTVLREPYDLPKQTEVLKVWCEQMNVTPESLAGLTKLCGLHFIDLYELTKEMVDKNEETHAELEQLAHTYNKACNSLTIRSAQCSVPGCTTNQLSSEYRLYPFPYNRELIEKWTQNTGVEVDEHRRYLQKVCGLHFETYCLTDTQRLRPWAIPTLHLNRDESNEDLPELHQNPDLNSVERRMLGRITYKCCVADCGRERSEDNSVRLFNFPTDEKVLEKWAYNLQLPREKCPLYKICEVHFETYCLGQSRLRSWAVPTLKLGHKNEKKLDIYRNPKKIVEKLARQDSDAMDVSESEDSDNEALAVANVKIKKSLAMIKCCVSSCRKSRLKHGVSLFPFPSNAVIYKKWCHNVQLTASDLDKQSRVCNLHFHKRCIDGKQLRPWAVPTLHLGHNETIYQNPKINIVIGSGANGITSCSLPHCSNYKTNNVKVRTVPFPTNQELLEKWCENLKITPDDECKERRICLQAHFEKGVIANGQLMAGAVPTLSLGHYGKLKHTNRNIKDETLSFDESEIEMSLKVHAPKTTTKPILKSEMFESVESIENSELNDYDTDAAKKAMSPDKKARMPNNIAPICCLKHCRKEKTAEQHLTTFGFPKDPSILDKWCDNLQLKPEECVGRVCIEHFELRVLGNRRLKPGAVPTLNLGHKNPLKHTNTNQIAEGVATKHEINTEVNKDCQTTDSNNTTMTSSIHNESDMSDVEDNFYAEKLDHSVFRLCCLKHCRRRRKKREKLTGTPSTSLRTFNFPRDLEQLNLWALNLRMPLRVCVSKKLSLRICEAHFEPDQIEGDHLKADAVPTLDLGYEEMAVSEEEKKQPKSCCVSGCSEAENNTDEQHESQIRLYDFPKRGAILRKWAFNTHQDAYTAQLEKFQICAQHFQNDCFEADGELKPGAVPTLALGHDALDIYESELNENTTLQSTNPDEQQQQLKVSCCISNCGGLKGQYIVSHFPFPTEEELLHKWCHNLRLEEEKCKGAYICSLHFKSGCIRKRVLHKLAVPTENLGIESDQEEQQEETILPNNEIYENPPEVFDNPYRMPETRCCARGCHKTRRDGVRMYQFPKLRSQYLKWAHNLGLKPTSKAVQYYKVCQLHFEPSCIRNKRLLPGSLPTLALGIDESAEDSLYYNKNIEFLADGKLGSPKSRKRYGQSKTYVKCAMRGCNLVRNSAIALISLPREDENLRNKWLDYIQDTGKSVVPPKLCALHFIQAYRALSTDDIEETSEMQENASPAAMERNKMRLRFKKMINSNHLKQLMCAVPGCNITYTDNITFHQFPKEQSVFMKWEHNTLIRADTQRRHVHKICALHFEERCFGAKRVRGWAIPTLRLPPQPEGMQIYENPKEVDITVAAAAIKVEDSSVARESSTMVETCCVTDCCNNLENTVSKDNKQLSENERIEFWTLPVDDSDTLEKWCHNLRIFETGRRALRRLRICSQHFEPYCFSEKYRLRHWAMPTRNLPNPPEDVSFEIYQNPVDVVFYNMCSINTCRQVRDRDAGIHLYSFPQRNEAYFEKWVHNVRLEPDLCRKSRICTLHFEKHVIKNRNLRKGAVPTLDLGHNEVEIFRNPKKGKKRKLHKNFSPKSFDIDGENEGNTDMESLINKQDAPSVPGICCMTACKEETTTQNETEIKNPRVYSFPKVDWLLQKWCENTRQNVEDAKELWICERHFEPHAIGKSKPRALAVPTLLLDNNEPIHENPKQLNKYHPEEKESGEVKYVRGNCCAIISCLNSKADGIQLYQYPHKKPFLQKWADNCRHHAYQAARYNFRICCKHFEENCFKENKRLRYGSVPTLHLGYEAEGPEVMAKLHSSEFQQLKRKRKMKKFTPILKPSVVVVKKCGVPNCGRTKQDDGVRLYKFPDDNELLTKWCQNLHLDPSECKDLLICNMHFEARCINQRGIFKRAIPTMLLGHSNIEGIELIKNPVDLQRPDNFLHCCVSGCGSTKLDPDITLSSFPKNRSLFEKWAHNLNVAPSNDLWHSYYKKVCNKHFESFCYEHKRLKVGSIPTLNLGHDNTDEIYTVNEEDLSFKHPKRGRREHHTNANDDVSIVLMCSYPDCKEIEKWRLRHAYDLPQFPVALHNAWQESLKKAFEAKNVAFEEEEPKLCPVHFKLFYDEHIQLLDDLKKSNTLTEDEQESFSKLAEINATVKQISRVRSLLCTVPDCRTNAFQSVTNAPARLYSLPINREQASKWCFNTNVSAEEEHRYLVKICGLHFEKECFLEASKRLRSWAIPTLNIPKLDDRTIFLNPTVTSSERSGIAAENLICCIQNCPNAKEKDTSVSGGDETTIKDNLQLFPFPREIPLMKKWLHNTGLSKRDVYKARICVLHFEKHCFNKRLRSWAIPTLNLDTDRTDLYQNPKIKRLLRAEKPKKIIPKTQDASQIQIGYQDALNEDSIKSELSKDESIASIKIKCEENSVTNETLNGNLEKAKRPRLSPVKESNGKMFLDYNLNINSELQKQKEKSQTAKALKQSLKNRQETSSPYKYSDNRSFLNSTEIEEESSTSESKKGLSTFLKSFDKNDIDDGFKSTSITESKDESFNPDEEQFSSELMDLNRSNSRHLVPKTEYKTVSYPTFKRNSQKSALDCHVPDCQTSRKKFLNVTLHTFPLDPNLFAKWAHNCQLDPNSERRRHYRICNRHFEQKYYRNGLQLVYGTVPTLELGSNPPAKIFENNDLNFKEKINPKINNNNNNSSAAHCCLLHCQKRSDKVQLFKFPESQEQKDKWMHNLGLQCDAKMPWKYLVCSEHFEKSSFDSRYGTDIKLHKWAIPTLNLGDNAPFLLCTEFKSESKPLPVHEGMVVDNDNDYISGNIDETENSLLDVIYERELTEERPTSSNSSTPSTSAISTPFTLNSRCCLPHCRNPRTRDIKLFAFPTSFEMAKEWQRILGMTLDERELRTKVICSQHFHPNVIGSRRLVGRFAFPTINLRPINVQPSAEAVAAANKLYSQPPLLLSNNVKQTAASLSTIVRPEPHRPDIVQAMSAIHNYIACNVPNCHNTSQNVRVFSQFPNDFQLFTKWCFNLRIDPRKYVEGEFNVCSVHFSRNFLSDDGLDEMAVPTLNLGHSGEYYKTTHVVSQRADLFKPITKIRKLQMEVEQVMQYGHEFLNVYTCCVQGCIEKRNLYDFPRNPSLRLQWAHNLQIANDVNDSKPKVCRKHFHKNCIRNDRLHPEAVPTLHLGHANAHLYPNRGSYEDASTLAVKASNSNPNTSYNQMIPINIEEDNDVVILDDDDDDDENYNADENNYNDDHGNGNDNDTELY